MAKKAKVYLLKVPVYVSEVKKFDTTDFFASKKENHIADVKSQIDNYNSDPKKVSSDKRAKTTTTVIESIKCTDISFNTDPCLLLQVTAYKTNLVDGFFQSGTNSEVRFAQSDKLGSDTNFFILYPEVKLLATEIILYWHIFIYEDPSKANEEMVRIARLLMNRILNRPIKNIKSDKLLEDLRKNQLIPQVKIKLSSFSDDDGDLPPYLSNYTVEKSTLKQEKDISLLDVSIDDAIELYNDDSFTGLFDKKSIKYITANKRILSVLKEYNQKITETLEDSFNYTMEIPEEIVKNGSIFDTQIIKNNVEGIFANYMHSVTTD